MKSILAPGRGQKAGPAEFKVPHWRVFPGVPGMPGPCRVPRGPDAVGTNSQVAYHQPQGTSEVLCAHPLWGPP